MFSEKSQSIPNYLLSLHSILDVGVGCGGG